MGQIETFRQFLKQRKYLYEKCARCSRLRRVISQQPTEVKRQVRTFSKQDNKHPQYQGNLLEGAGRGWLVEVYDRVIFSASLKNKALMKYGRMGFTKK